MSILIYDAETSIAEIYDAPEHIKEIAKHCELVDVYKSRRGKIQLMFPNNENEEERVISHSPLQIKF